MALLLSHSVFLPCVAAGRPTRAPVVASVPACPAPRRHLRQPPSWALHQVPICQAQGPSEPATQPPADDEEFEGLADEEDEEVPGNYGDAMNPNSKLGKAVRAAVKELDHLNTMENEVLTQADALLKKLGIKMPPIKPPPKEAGADDDDEEEEAVESASKDSSSGKA
eukprot:CAMPEP_0202865140 /NCGR_PEP_ID=MMETSP1391-20130828/5297_1 /ASSEMBLY_ACC=CAM_ASM_000867 /TAXON_ID=1034604 /ORGANISM="Chlamydomonas leiostraca, Strain SAG 11-49" /LENGTH=166 /DNA_ID=CAMNT_0049544943 /DNA_START=9 /DNA_END=509 /DNA_ORIENTATION=-